MSRTQHAVQFGTVARVLVLSLFLGGAGVGYVIQKQQIRSLSRELESNKDRIADLSERRRELKKMLSAVTREDNILNGVRHFGLQLGKPERVNVITLDEPAQPESQMARNDNM